MRDAAAYGLMALVLGGAFAGGLAVGRQRLEAGPPPSHELVFDKVCVDGVTYLRFAAGAAVQVDATGRPVPCM